MRPTDELLSLPNVSWAAEALELVFAVEGHAVANHSVRSWAFARILAEHESMAHEVDDALLFAATVLHDIGLRHDARAPVRFEVDGADYAAEFLTARQLAAGDVDRVWEAIALHSSHGLAERRGLLTYLTYRGVFIDAGRDRDAVAEGLRKEVLNAYPKPTQGPYLAEAIIEHAQRSPAAAPPGSLGAYLLLQHQHG